MRESQKSWVPSVQADPSRMLSNPNYPMAGGNPSVLRGELIPCSVLAIVAAGLLFDSQVLNLLTTALAVFVAMFGRERHGWWLLGALAPFYGIFTLPYVGVAYLYLAVPFCLRQLFLGLANKRVTFSWRQTAIVLFVMSVTISNAIDVIFAGGILAIREIIFMLILLVLTVMMKYEDETSISLMRGFAFGTVVSIFVGLILSRYLDVWASVGPGASQFQRFIGSVGDPNYASRCMLFALCYVIYLMSRRSSNLLIALGVSLIFGILLTKSKMGLLVLLLLSGFVWFGARRKQMIRLSHVITIVPLLFIALVWHWAYFETIILDILGRFSSTGFDLNAASTHRFALQTTALESWSNWGGKLIYGMGPNTSATLTTDIYEGGLVLHSIYIQALVEQGLVGFLLLCFFLFSLFHARKGELILRNLHVFIFLLCGSSLSGLYYWDQFVFYLVAYSLPMSKSQNSTGRQLIRRESFE